MRLLGVAIALGLMTAPASAQKDERVNMTVGQFVAKNTLPALRQANAPEPFLKRAMASGQQNAADVEFAVMVASNLYLARLAGERRTGTPSSCPPTGLNFKSDAMLVELSRFMANQPRDRLFRAAFPDFMMARYPC